MIANLIRSTKSMITIVLLFGAAAGVAAQNTGKPLGMIADVEGTVTVQRGSARERAQLADLLFAGDRITTAANSKVTFSFCPGSDKNERISLNAGSTIVISAAAVQQSGGTPAIRGGRARCALPEVALGKRELERIGVMPARGSPPISLYVGGAISTTRPLFTWAHVPTVREYTLGLRPQGGGKDIWTWTHTGEASEIRLPETIAELKPGIYTWILTGRANGEIVAQQMANFEVKPDPAFSSAGTAAALDTLSQLELATAFENARYYAEAAAIYRVLRAKNGNDPKFTRHLVWLYRTAGLFAAYNEEVERSK
jgi:hypothetical protein